MPSFWILLDNKQLLASFIGEFYSGSCSPAHRCTVPVRNSQRKEPGREREGCLSKVLLSLPSTVALGEQHFNILEKVRQRRRCPPPLSCLNWYVLHPTKRLCKFNVAWRMWARHLGERTLNIVGWLFADRQAHSDPDNVSQTRACLVSLAIISKGYWNRSYEKWWNSGFPVVSQAL